MLNHPQWGIPVTGFTDPNFMRIRAFDNNRVRRARYSSACGSRSSLSNVDRNWPGAAFRCPGLF